MVTRTVKRVEAVARIRPRRPVDAFVPLPASTFGDASVFV